MKSKLIIRQVEVLSIYQQVKPLREVSANP